MQKRSIFRIVDCHKSVFVAGATFFVLTSAMSAVARVVTVSGGISTGYEWYDRQYDDDGSDTSNSQKDDKYSRFRISPLIEMVSLSERDEFRMSYSPSFSYNFDDSSDHIDHNLSADVNRFLTQKWQMLLSDNYRRTDEPNDTTAADSGDNLQISDSNGRKRYWTNDLSVSSEYTYWQDSLFSLGYTYSVYRVLQSYSENDNEDFDRHSFSTSVGHRFNSIWKLSVSGNYVRGLYNEVNSSTGTSGGQPGNSDLKEYSASTTLESSLIEHQPLSLTYSYFEDKYDDPDLDGSTIHSLSLGWQWNVSNDLSVNLSGGPTYAKTDGQNGTWGTNENLSLLQQLERGSISLAASHGFDTENFSGTDQNGLQEFYETRGDFNYSLLENVSLGLFSSYRHENQDTISPVLSTGGSEVETITRKRFSAGSNLSYMFQRWYTLSLSYTYTNQNSEEINDSYDEHRVALTLSFNKDFFHW